MRSRRAKTFHCRGSGLLLARAYRCYVSSALSTFHASRDFFWASRSQDSHCLNQGCEETLNTTDTTLVGCLSDWCLVFFFL